MDEKQAIREVEEIYAEVEGLDLSRDCVGRTRCCHFRLTGKTPMLTAGEALLAARAVRASGRKRLPASNEPTTGRCPFLGSDGQCAIYQDRPFGCRTHFCGAAGGPYPRKALRHLIHRLEKVAEMIAPGSDPRPLEGAISDALSPPSGRRKRQGGSPR